MATHDPGERARIRDYGTRIVQAQAKDRPTRKITLPLGLDATDFPIDVGAELRVELREPENELVLVPEEE